MGFNRYPSGSKCVIIYLSTVFIFSSMVKNFDPFWGRRKPYTPKMFSDFDPIYYNLFDRFFNFSVFYQFCNQNSIKFKHIPTYNVSAQNRPKTIASKVDPKYLSQSIREWIRIQISLVSVSKNDFCQHQSESKFALAAKKDQKLIFINNGVDQNSFF